MIGGTYLRPVIMPPQVVIGGLGAIKPRLEFDENDEIVEKQAMCVSFSADHRLLDGATTARFVAAWKRLIEEPSLMLLNLK
jgi:2-oxoisovalerate dehydrogenase E2 component (dihydrolipoyl transacylase)